jgi:hypothetical protein
MKPDRLDRAIRWLMVLMVLAVATFAGIESYTHIFTLAMKHHETGAALRMYPLSVDWFMIGAGLLLLHESRRSRSPAMGRMCLALGVGVTLFANLAYGFAYGWLAAVIAAWAPVALFLTVEMGMYLVRSASAKPLSDPVAGPSIETMQRILENLPAEKTPRPFPPDAEAVAGPDSLQGWGQLGRPEAGLEGIGLAPGNGRK